MRSFFIVGIFSFFFIVLSTPLAATAATTCPSGNFTPVAGVCVPNNTGLSNMPIALILKNFMNWLLGIFGFLGIIAFIISGIQYLTSAGDEKMAETAKNNMKYSIIGIIVALSGYVVILAIDAALNANPYF